eukprot:TRINITY_DN14831_c0_g1_i1.p1 TRINITY_DN14831_c0_g1~~TRINITY_DN14831_c0_g1_i1.p1  ORF type:complete len:188 (-),score=34.40 TRINITY_DN14831_c0_g1_i1:547-1047(-)
MSEVESDKKCFHCLYRLTQPVSEDSDKQKTNDDDDKSKSIVLEVLLTDLSAEQEKKLRLRKYIVHKIETNLIHESGSLGILPTFVTKNKISGTTVCYYSLITSSNNDTKLSRYIICLISIIDSDGFNLFSNDLAKFAGKLKEYLYPKPKEDEKEKWLKYLSNWSIT